MDRMSVINIGNFTLSRTTGQELPQPVRIAQLFESSSRSRNGQRNEVREISLPERITPYLKNTSSKKKDAKNLCSVKLSHGEKNVRRNLNFTKIPTTVKIKKFVKGHRNLKEKTFSLSTRSSLLPPNTIKDLYVKSRFKSNRSMLPRSCTLTSDSEKKNYPEIFEGLNNLLPMEDKNTYADSVLYEKNEKILVAQDILPQTLNVNDQSGISILYSPRMDCMNDEIGEKFSKNLNFDKILDNNQNDRYITTINDDACNNSNDKDIDKNDLGCTDLFATNVLPDAEKEVCSVNTKENKCSSAIVNDCGNSRTLPIIVEHSDLQSTINKGDEYVSLNKTELPALVSILKGVICRMEKNLSDMKLMLIAMDLLSTINVTNKETNDNTIQQIMKNLNNKVEISKGTIDKSPIRDAVNTGSDNVMAGANDMIDIKYPQTDLIRRANSAIQSSCELILSSMSVDKENEIPNMPNNIKQHEESKSGTRRRSARLMAKSLNNLTPANDSFLDLENKLNINVESNMSLKSYTPMINKGEDKRVGKPLKEYLALKSRMSCLLTPNIKRFNSSKVGKNSSKSGDTRVSLSNKVLADLYNLYGDSIDTE